MLKLSHPRHRIAFISCLALASSALLPPHIAEAQEIEPTVRFLESGRYAIAVSGTSPATPDTSGSVVVNGHKVAHLETTGKIPLRLGEHFGYQFELSGLQVGRTYELQHLTEHPPIPQPDGRVLKQSVTAEKFTAASNSMTDHHLWGFLKGYEYELVPGIWTMHIYLNGQKVSSMSFEVGNLDAGKALKQGDGRSASLFIHSPCTAARL